MVNEAGAAAVDVACAPEVDSPHKFQVYDAAG